jgi:hypothetical protein
LLERASTCHRLRSCGRALELQPEHDMKRLHITWALIAGWLTVALGAITAVTPVLPHEWDVAVPWLRPALGVAAVLIAAILRAPQTPTTATIAAQIETARVSTPTTPAADAKRDHIATQRGDVPTTVPRQARANEDDETLDGPLPPSTGGT